VHLGDWLCIIRRCGNVDQLAACVILPRVFGMSFADMDWSELMWANAATSVEMEQLTRQRETPMV
jgi:hypothetical protein